MKYFSSVVIFLFLLFPQAYAAELCDLFNSSEFSDLINLSVPNCLTDANIDDEIYQLDSTPSAPGPICGDCRRNLESKITISNQDRQKLKQQAYFNGMANEYKKAMSDLMTDMLTIRKLFSTGSNFGQSSNKCSVTAFERKINISCNDTEKSFFKSSGLQKSIASELAALLSQEPGQAAGILPREGDQNLCKISDQAILSLKPLLLDSKINPTFVKIIANSSVKDTNALWDLINNSDSQLYDLMKHHPILKSMAEKPQEFISFFKSLVNVNDPEQLKNAFRNNLYTKQNGDKLDLQTAERCESATNNLINKICSSSFDSGNISLGNIRDFNKVNNNQPSPKENLVTKEDVLSRNLTMMEFCNSNTPTGLNFNLDSHNLAPWLIENDKNKSLHDVSEDKFNKELKTPRNKVCDFHRKKACDVKGPECDLYELYEKTITPGSQEYRLANTPDKSVNSVLRAMIGTPENLDKKPRDILIAEGILPQADGKFAEKPEIPERKPDYLANVANGTINPNSGAQTQSASLAAPSTQTRSQPRSQQATIQPNYSNSATNDTELAQADTDDQEALRKFQNGLDDRLKRIENQTTNLAQQQPTKSAQKTIPRGASRSFSSDRSNDQLQAVSGIPAPVTASLDSPAVVAPQGSPSAGGAALSKDNSRQTRAEVQANDARAQMFGARTNPSATGGGASLNEKDVQRSPASTQSVSTVALTINGDIRANIEQVLNGTSANGSDLRSLIQSKQPFLFELNNSVFDVQFNNGSYSVSYRSGDNSGATLATTLESLFNNSLRNTSPTRLTDLKNSFSN